jgi:fructose-1,6-bisphosphatase
VVDTKFFVNTPDAIASKHSAYSEETKVMRMVLNNLMKNIKEKESLGSKSSDVSEKVLEIIKENGKEFRYSIGNDAEAMIAALESCNDDQSKMDVAINNIMKEWM